MNLCSCDSELPDSWSTSRLWNLCSCDSELPDSSSTSRLWCLPFPCPWCPVWFPCAPECSPFSGPWCPVWFLCAPECSPFSGPWCLVWFPCASECSSFSDPWLAGRLFDDGPRLGLVEIASDCPRLKEPFYENYFSHKNFNKILFWNLPNTDNTKSAGKISFIFFLVRKYLYLFCFPFFKILVKIKSYWILLL